MPEFAYDAVRYSNYPYAQTHPERLATVAILHGLEPPDPFTARVLEIGCGAGGNLLAMAAATPELHAVGVDLAATAIEEGRAAVEAVGLRNVELHQGDVRDLVTGPYGPFDYIVAHGVYGWVPEDARDALLATIGASLAPDGIAYVSYNAQPGGYFRRMLRDAGRWHARDVEPGDELARADKAQELFKFLKEHRATTADVYGALLDREVPALSDGPLYRLVHDDLSDFWHPVWFADFAAHAAAHGLGYVGEADLYSLRVEMLPEGVEPEVWRLAGGDRIAFENYSDLLTCRHFRQSVLCRAGAVVEPEPVPERAERLHWAVRLNAEPLEVGLVADIYAELDRDPSARAGLRDAARAARGRSGDARGGAAGGLPARAPDPACGPAARGERSRRAPGGLTPGPLAGGSRTGADLAGLHDRAHGGARRPAADHAARRHPGPRRRSARNCRPGRASS